MDQLMSRTSKPIGPKRYRETFGRYYEEFDVGDIYEHRPGRTITRPTIPGSRC